MSQPVQSSVNALVGGGYSPLVAMVLASRGMKTVSEAQNYLACDCALPDPWLMTDMKPAVARLRTALERHEKIAVFGDYDVDGITATCLLTDYLIKQGALVIPYIPGRLEEGYGLNEIAIRQLQQEGVKLIVTVDCGITAIEEARLCKKIGIDLIITDHHECKDFLPNAVAVLDPHRPDGGYPHRTLSGVGVAFKLTAALCGSQLQVLAEYGDMVCLGTVADVMPLQGENRVFVTQGLEALRHTQRPGLIALMNQCGCDPLSLNASSVGYILAPRINAAGRIGHIELAIELFLTKDPIRAKEVAASLCELNRQRQAVEAQIYEQAKEMLPTDALPEAIVLADESWHQGVVGIVASRISEEYCCPTFLVCLDGDHGKASSRSYGGFNLFASLTQLQKLLESYGGHELAAGFTIHRKKIPAFRQEICRLAREYYNSDQPRTQLSCDCTVTPELITLSNIEALDALEPCGNGCPKPVLIMEKLTVERISQVGGGKHMRLQLWAGHHLNHAIFFSATPESADIAVGDLVDVAFHPQINEFRGTKTVQLNLLDIRPSCTADCSWEKSLYTALLENRLSTQDAKMLLPSRELLGTVWRYLMHTAKQELREDPLCLCRKIVRWSNQGMNLGQLLTCLDIFSDVGLVEIRRPNNCMIIRLSQSPEKRDLNESPTMQKLLAAVQ